MCRVIEGVWIEMLYFSASRCRGYLHAKSLGYGGKYLSFVSLLMLHAGLERFPERQQSVQHQTPVLTELGGKTAFCFSILYHNDMLNYLFFYGTGGDKSPTD